MQQSVQPVGVSRPQSPSTNISAVQGVNVRFNYNTSGNSGTPTAHFMPATERRSVEANSPNTYNTHKHRNTHNTLIV